MRPLGFEPKTYGLKGNACTPLFGPFFPLNNCILAKSSVFAIRSIRYHFFSAKGSSRVRKPVVYR